jgi:acyl-CoA synthetase (AMP-forming)/AMP-acid ligase II
MTTSGFLALQPIDPAAPSTLGGFLAELAGRFGPAEAVVSHDALHGGARVSWSFAELHQRSSEVARALAAAHLGKGERVGILMGNRPEFLAALFGVAMAGGLAVTLSTFSTAAEMRVLLEQSSVSLLLTQRTIARRSLIDVLEAAVPGLAGGQIADPGVPFLRRVIAVGGAGDARVEDWAEFLAAGAGVGDAALAAREASVSGSDEGVVIFTSGTTSQPKGVLHLHATVVAQSRCQAELYGRYPGIRVGSPFPLFWSAGLVSVACSTLAAGGTYVADEVFEPGATLDLIRREAINEWYGFPTHTAALAEHPDWPEADLHSLTRVRGAYEFDGHPHTSPDPGWHHVIAYGMSESCTFLTSHFSSTPREIQLQSAGLPMPGVEIRITALDGGLPLPAGEEGEICVRGPLLMPHYLGMRREDSFDTDGFFHTGDLGCVDAQGYLHWTGRAKAMIKTGGANVAPAEIEAVASGLGSLKLCRAIGIPDKRLGEMIVLCAVREDGATIDEASVRAALREKLAAFKVPRRVLFFAIEDYPLTSSGKVRDGELADLVHARLIATAVAQERS